MNRAFARARKRRHEADDDGELPAQKEESGRSPAKRVRTEEEEPPNEKSFRACAEATT